MYKLTRFVEKLKYVGYVEFTKLYKFKRKLCTSDVQIVWIYGKILNALDTLNSCVRSHEPIVYIGIYKDRL